MKSSSLLIACLITLGSATSFVAAPPTWTAAELAAANTAKNVTYMDSTEKDIIMYCNLARMYPKRFVAIEIEGEGYGNSDATISLIRELKANQPRTALQPDSALAETASCFQKELEKSGEVGHKRKNCTEDYMGENCSFGESNAKSVTMQLLIDDGVPTYGHRRNILNTEYTKIGVAFGGHKKYFSCAVLDFK